MATETTIYYITRVGLSETYAIELRDGRVTRAATIDRRGRRVTGEGIEWRSIQADLYERRATNPDSYARYIIDGYGEQYPGLVDCTTDQALARYILDHSSEQYAGEGMTGRGFRELVKQGLITTEGEMSEQMVRKLDALDDPHKATGAAISSQYDSRCARCGGAVAKGASIEPTPAGWSHAGSC